MDLLEELRDLRIAFAEQKEVISRLSSALGFFAKIPTFSKDIKTLLSDEKVRKYLEK